MVQLARRVLKNSFYNTLRVLISGFGGFAFSIALARLLTPEQFGIYALATSICFLVLQLDPGTNDALIRYLSYSIGKGKIELARGYVRFISKIKLILGFVFSITLAILSNYVAEHIFGKPELGFPLLILSAFLFFFYMTDYVEAFFIAFQEFRYSTIRHAIYEFLKFCFVVIPYILIIKYFYGIFFGLLAAAFLVFLIMLMLCIRKFKCLFIGETTEIKRVRVLRYIGFLSIGAISGTVFSYVDIIMLGMFLPPEYAGYYKAATNVVFAIVGLASISNVLFPVFTQLEGESLENAFKKVVRYSAIVSFPASVGLCFFSEQIVKVIYGVEYIPASIPLMILSPLIIFSSINFFGVLFNSKEKPEYNTIFTIITMSLNIVLNYILILKMGMIGAAIATTFSRFVGLILPAVASWRVFKISPDVKSLLYPTLSSGVVLLILTCLPRPESIFVGILEILALVLLYFVVMFWIGGINREDMQYFMKILGIR